MEKQRLLNAIKQMNNDRPPCICPGGMMNMAVRELMEQAGIKFPLAHIDAQAMADLAAAACESQCFENYGVPFCMTIEAEQLGAAVDLGDINYEPRVVEYPFQSVDEWAKLIKPVSSSRADVVTQAIKILKAKNEHVPIIANLTGPISVASSLIEPTVFYKELRRKNKAAHEFMEFVTQSLIDFGCEQLVAGADIITISDPSGTGEIMGPALFDEFVVRYLNMLLDGIERKFGKVPTIVHICGRVHKVYTQLNKLKCDVLSFDAFVSMKQAKENLPNHTIMGNVSTYAIERATPDKVAVLAKKAVSDGVHILSPACGLGLYSPLANIKAMLASAKGEFDA